MEYFNRYYKHIDTQFKPFSTKILNGFEHPWVQKHEITYTYEPKDIIQLVKDNNLLFNSIGCETCIQPLTNEWQVDLDYSLTALALAEYRRYLYLSKLFVGVIEMLDEANTTILIVDTHVQKELTNSNSIYKDIFSRPSTLFHAIAEFSVLHVLFKVITMHGIDINISEFLDIYVYRIYKYVDVYHGIEAMLKRIEHGLIVTFVEYVNAYNKELRFNTPIYTYEAGEDELYNYMSPHYKDQVVSALRTLVGIDDSFDHYYYKNPEDLVEAETPGLINAVELEEKGELKDIKKLENTDIPEDEREERKKRLDYDKNHGHPTYYYSAKADDEDILVASHAKSRRGFNTAFEGNRYPNITDYIDTIASIRDWKSKAPIKIDLPKNITLSPEDTRDLMVYGITVNGSSKEVIKHLCVTCGKKPLMRSILNDMANDKEGVRLLEEAKLDKRFYKGDRRNHLKSRTWPWYEKRFFTDKVYDAIDAYYKSKADSVTNKRIVTALLHLKKKERVQDIVERMDDAAYHKYIEKAKKAHMSISKYIEEHIDELDEQSVIANSSLSNDTSYSDTDPHIGTDSEDYITDEDDNRSSDEE